MQYIVIFSYCSENNFFIDWLIDWSELTDAEDDEKDDVDDELAKSRLDS